MNNVIDNLMAIQDLQLNKSKPGAERAGQLTRLRSQIPEALLAAFDRFTARDKKPVSVVRNGVCSECHIRIAVGTLSSLAFGQEVQQCGNCGRFLYLPEDEKVCGPEVATKPKTGRVHPTSESAVHA